MATLGQFLREREWITEAQLAAALERQQQLGGRLGTCLLELGVLTEDLLLQALSERYGVSVARAADFENIDQELVELLPKELAVSARAIPFRSSGRRVQVAMLDSADLSVQDEIAFAIGKPIDFHVASELRIAEALARYYGTALPTRLSSLAIQMSRLQPLQEQPQKSTPQTAQTAPIAPPDETEDPQPVRRVIPQQAKAVLERVPLTPEERKALEKFRQVSGGSERPEAVFTRRLEHAETSSDVGRALLDVLASQLVRVLLFRVLASRHEVRGWLARGPDLDFEWFENYSISLPQASIFRQLEATREPFRGTLDRIPSHVALARCWGGSLDHDCLMLPIFVRDHLVCVVYGDRASLGVTGVDMELAGRLVGKAAIGFERVILKQKLQAG